MYFVLWSLAVFFILWFVWSVFLCFACPSISRFAKRNEQTRWRTTATNEVFHFDFGFKINYILQMITVSWFPSVSGLYTQRRAHCHLYDSRYSIKSNPFLLDLSISWSLCVSSLFFWEILFRLICGTCCSVLFLFLTICLPVCLPDRLSVCLIVSVYARSNVHMYVSMRVCVCVCSIFKDPVECCYFEHPAAFNWWSKKWHSQQQHHLLCVSMITLCYSVHTLTKLVIVPLSNTKIKMQLK